MVEFSSNAEHSIAISCDGVKLAGILYIPEGARGIVIFVHGSGSGRLSPRNQYIARELQNNKFATLLFDLLTQEEDEKDAVTAQYRFDISFLAYRLQVATSWVIKNLAPHQFSIGYFGASTGGAAALVAAVKYAKEVKAVVSRGGRPDLAYNALKFVEAPTLLIVGGDDGLVINLNNEAYDSLVCIKKIEIVPGATHLFEEPGKLEAVSKLANAWFVKYLS